ncbi:MAG: hypothetical protein ACFFDS_06545 [Candidatus Thorarchaeota archaeon]
MKRIKINYKLTLLFLSIIDIILIVLLVLNVTQIICYGLDCLFVFYIVVPTLVVFDILTIIVGFRYYKQKKEKQPVETGDNTQAEA